jgi:outer membrane protein insertion porin family
MVNFSSSRTTDAVRRGALGLALALPLISSPALRAQENPAEQQQDQPQTETVEVEVEQVDVETIQVEEVLPAQQDTPDDEPAQQQPAAEQQLPPEQQPAVQEPLEQAPAQPRVLISEVVIEGIAGHPEQERLELAAYDAMTVRPGSRVTRDQLKTDLDAIYATGWFSDVRIEPINGPLGVQLLVKVVPNPVLTKVELEPDDTKMPPEVVEQTFSSDYGRTLNLNELQLRMKELQGWYAKEGYSLARLSGPSRVSPEGVVQLKVVIGTVAGVEVEFLNREGESTNDKGEPIKGKTKPWVVTREISIKPGEPFNRNQLEGDIKRLYSTSLFSDVKVTLKPVAGEPGTVNIILGIVEQSTVRCSSRTAICSGAPGISRSTSPMASTAAWRTSLSPIPGSKVISGEPPSAPRCS